MGSKPKENKPMGSEPFSCPWCASKMKAAADGLHHANPKDGPDAWAASLVCLTCGSTGPWGKGDTKAEAIQAAEHKARDLLRRMAAPPAEGGE